MSDNEKGKILDFVKAHAKKTREESPFSVVESPVEIEHLSSEDYVEICAKEIMRVLYEHGFTMEVLVDLDGAHHFSFKNHEYRNPPHTTISISKE